MGPRETPDSDEAERKRAEQERDAAEAERQPMPPATREAFGPTTWWPRTYPALGLESLHEFVKFFRAGLLEFAPADPYFIVGM